LTSSETSWVGVLVLLVLLGDVDCFGVFSFGFLRSSEDRLTVGLLSLAKFSTESLQTLLLEEESAGLSSEEEFDGDV